MIKQISTLALPLTRELVRQFDALLGFPGERTMDRPDRRERAQYFYRHLEHRTFLQPHWHTVNVKDEGVIYRMDGRCTSFVLLHCPDDVFPTGDQAEVVMTHWEIDNMWNDGPAFYDYFCNPDEKEEEEPRLSESEVREIREMMKECWERFLKERRVN